MLMNTAQLTGLVIRATDGDIGTVDDLYFDDQSWVIRYLTVQTGDWLAERRVLISPISIVKPDWQASRLDVALTRKQVENSPDINTHKPLSRQHEAEYMSYYGYADYWNGPNPWGQAFFPTAAANLELSSEDTIADTVQKPSADSHLRSNEGVAGYSIEATDGEIGHLAGFAFDDHAWAIRYIEIATRNWWPGKKVLISPAWIQWVSWEQSHVYCGVSREKIQSAPEYKDAMPITREYENRLHSHYGRPPYWLPASEQGPLPSLMSV